MIGKNSALPFGTVTVRVTESPKVPVRKKYLFPGPIPCAWSTLAYAPVESRTGLVFVPCDVDSLSGRRPTSTSEP